MCNGNNCEEDHRRLRRKLSRCERKPEIGHLQLKVTWPTKCKKKKKKKMTGYNLNNNRDWKSMKV